MPYYNTMEEDLKRAKEILAEGREPIDSELQRVLPPDVVVTQGATIYGKDTYAAYKLLESFVEAIEAIGPKVCELAIRNERRAKSFQRLDHAIDGQLVVRLLADDAQFLGAAEPGETLEDRRELEQEIATVRDERDVAVMMWQRYKSMAGECICRTRHCQHGAHLHHNGVCEVCNKGNCWC